MIAVVEFLGEGGTTAGRSKGLSSYMDGSRAAELELFSGRSSTLGHIFLFSFF